MHINQSKKAQKRIQQIADSNFIDYEIVYPLISLFWNYDGEGSWAKYENKKDDFDSLSGQVKSKLQISNSHLQKDECVEKLLQELAVRKSNGEAIYNQFLYGAKAGSNVLISEFASFHYLRNADYSRLLSMDWSKKADTENGMLWVLFLKLFRSGIVDRNNLDYVYADLCFQLPCKFDLPQVEDWVANFVAEVKVSSKINLTGLRKLLQNYLPNAKKLSQEQSILESLAFANILKVEGYPVDDVFLFDKRYELSSHFYSNEWHYPLRFWNER